MFSHLIGLISIVLGPLLRDSRQRCEQYLTSSQDFSHFLRHANGRSQEMQIFWGSSDFRRIFITLIWVITYFFQVLLLIYLSFIGP